MDSEHSLRPIYYINRLWQVPYATLPTDRKKKRFEHKLQTHLSNSCRVVVAAIQAIRGNYNSQKKKPAPIDRLNTCPLN